MTSAPPDPNAVPVEVVKLTLQLAQADHLLAPAEAERVRQMARVLGIGADGLAALEQWLSGAARLPAPNLGLLRAHREQALRACAQVAAADGAVTAEEHDMLGEVAALLKR